jgi:hypothetical protein
MRIDDKGEKIMNLMNLRRLRLLTVFAFAFLLCPAAEAQSARRLTTTLLPLSPQQTLVDGSFWIQSKPGKDITLKFDLSGLPAGIDEDDFKCTLRLGAQTIVYKPKDKKENPYTGSRRIVINGESDQKQLLVLNFPDDNAKVATASTPELSKTVYGRYSSAGDKTISLRLFSTTADASSLFYSTSTPNAPPSNLPRLVIEYTLDAPSLLEAMSWPEHQQNPEHTGRSVLKPYESPAGFRLQRIDLPKIDGASGTAAVVDYPLIYQGNLYVVEKVSNKNYLLILDFKGNKLKQREIGTGTIQRSPVISRNGIFYIVTKPQLEDTVTKPQLVGYDLNRDGAAPFSWNIPGDDQPGKLAPYTDLTIGNDGSLFFALREKGTNYIYGLTSDLKPFLKAGPFSTEKYRISTVTVSSDGKRVFAETARGPIVIDITNPKDEVPKGKEKDDQYYHVPIAGPLETRAPLQKPEPPRGIMIFSDFLGHASDGADISGYSAVPKPIWNLPGNLLPQPVLGSNGLVYFLRDGKLHSHPYDKVGDSTISVGEKLSATSNLVMDGANNIYFWQSGILQGYRPATNDLFTATDLPELKQRPGKDKDDKDNKDEPEQFVRLMVGPDGTLWANNSGADFLYAFKPTYAKPDLTLTPAQLKQDGNADTPRIYRTTGTLTVVDAVSDPPTLAAGTKTLLQAQEGIAFGKNFGVEKGATLLCRTGF